MKFYWCKIHLACSMKQVYGFTVHFPLLGVAFPIWHAICWSRTP